MFESLSNFQKTSPLARFVLKIRLLVLLATTPVISAVLWRPNSLVYSHHLTPSVLLSWGSRCERLHLRYTSLGQVLAIRSHVTARTHGHFEGKDSPGRKEGRQDMNIALYSQLGRSLASYAHCVIYSLSSVTPST